MLRVKAQLDEADRLDTLRDQVTLLRESAELASRLADELVAASPVGDKRDEVVAAVNEQLGQLQRADEATVLPENLDRILRDGYGGLDEARRLAASPDATPFNVVTAYYNLVNGLSALSSGIVARSGNQDLEGPGKAVEAMLRLRGLQGMDQVVLRLNQAGQPLDVGTGQRTTSEEAILTERVKRDLPADKVDTFANLMKTAEERRSAFQAAIADTKKVSPPALLPKIGAEAKGLDTLLGEVLDRLDGQAGALADDAQAQTLRESALVVVALLAAFALALLVGRTLLNSVRTLRSAALDVAHAQLPATVERIRDGEHVDWRNVTPVPVHTTEEIGQLGRAFDEMHQQAVRLAGEQADLRRQVADMFTTLSRRSQSLVELQLETLEKLESDEQDPQRLDGLFKLDHLATRLRRNGENLQVLAGGTPARRASGPVSVVEVLRAAISEMNDYRRVNLGRAPDGSVRSPAAADIVHILSELLENAARFSPPDKKVVLTADRGSDGGLLIQVVDSGIGMAPDELAAANERLAAADEATPETTRRMGLFVVSRLAERHGVRVRLRATRQSKTQAGVTASVHIPVSLVIFEEAPAPMMSDAMNGYGRMGGLNGNAPALTDMPPRDWFVPMTEPSGQDLVTVGDARTARRMFDAPAAPPPPPPPPPPMAPPAPLPPLPTRQAGQPTTRPAPPAAESAWSSLGSNWPSPEPGRHELQTGGTTNSGLPMRRPGAGLTHSATPETEPAHALQRDPESIRSNLARHYSGVRTARTRGPHDENGTAQQQPKGES
ncbi:HAMP domain-containing sensor histidine kinase [Actinophytocola sp.]|uniref:HAMP domain-containing sensor histidine kinase n=1 Tax=Actinophytocola sp. TaxID=1872138 RepID=UPI002D7EE5E4|nr:ATP-binding protein [Actinophytocola sp.]